MMTGSVPLQCPICEGVIELEEPKVGAQVECPDCNELYLITALDPVKLSYALDMEAEGEYPEEGRRQAGEPV